MAEKNMRGMRSAVVRRENLATILSLVHERGSVSRSQLVSHSGLTRSAIGGLVSDLAELGFVTEGQSASEGRRGRPSSSVAPLGETNVALSVVVMVDSISVSAVGLGGRLLGSTSALPDRSSSAVGDTVDTIVRLLGIVRDDLPTDARVFGIGVAVPGLIRHSDGSVVVAPNFGWLDVPLGRLLRERLGDSVQIFVQNEANVGALAEFRRGAAAGIEHGIYLSGEVGVGGGIIANGELAIGVAGFAGEVGHMQVNPDGGTCRCGARGCWESEVGEEALLARAGLNPSGGPAELEELLRRASVGDAVVCRALEDHGRWVGVGVASLINIFNPEVVVLGGLFAETFLPMRNALEAELATTALAASRSPCAVLASDLRERALPLGAGELVWDVVFSDPGGAVTQQS